MQNHCLLTKCFPLFTREIEFAGDLTHDQETTKPNEVRKKQNKRQKRHTQVRNGPANQAQAAASSPTPREPQLKRQVIHAMLKGQVQLNCNIQPSEQDDAVSLVLWYKDKSTVPIYR